MKIWKIEVKITFLILANIYSAAEINPCVPWFCRSSVLLQEQLSVLSTGSQCSGLIMYFYSHNFIAPGFVFNLLVSVWPCSLGPLIGQLILVI